jgi:hypothetical protein
MNGKPDWTVAFPKVDKDGHTHWKQIGVGFNQRNGRGITLMLDALPISWGDGILSIYPIPQTDQRHRPENP